MAAHWQLTLEPPYTQLSYNYAAPAATADGHPVVLKLGFPNKELSIEIMALRAFNGRGAVKLIDADEARGALLLERLEPGGPLIQIEDDRQATTILCDVIQRLSKIQVAQSIFPSVADWGQGFARLRAQFVDGHGPFPEDLVARAESLYGLLVTSSDKPILLHGDLHHGNVLSAQRQPWLAIDPKGVLGEPAYEVGACLRNPVHQMSRLTSPETVLARRVDIFVHELGLDRERVLGWAFSQAVLSAWWAYEDNQKDWQEPLEWAGLLEEIS